jgi:hypothetical protein
LQKYRIFIWLLNLPNSLSEPFVSNSITFEMSSSTDSSTSFSTLSAARKAPKLEPGEFTYWETLFKSFCGRAEWALLLAPEPEIDQITLTNYYWSLDR